MSVNLGRIYEGDYGQDLISNFNNNATALEGAISDIDTSLGSKVGSSNVAMLREYNGALQYSLDGSEWKSADLTAWGNITGLLNDQIDLRDALNAKAAKATVDSQQIQINNLSTDLGTISGNVTTLGNSVSTLSGQVDNFASQIADMVTSGNIAYIRQVEEGGIKYFEWSADNINWVRSVVGDSAEWGNITGSLIDQTDLSQALSNLDTSINGVAGDLAITDSNLATLGGTVNSLDTTVSGHTSVITSLQTDKADTSTVSAHISNTNNPHSVTKAQVGLGNVDNTADVDKPLSNVQRASVESLLNGKGYVVNSKNVSDLWLGTEADYLIERDLNRETLYFISDTIDFDFKYFTGDIPEDGGIDVDNLHITYSETSSGGYKDVSIQFENNGSSAITVDFNSGVVVTDQSTYNFTAGQFNVASGGSYVITSSSFVDTEIVDTVSIDIKWK